MNCSSYLDVSFEGEVITHMSTVNVAEPELVGSGGGGIVDNVVLFIMITL